MNSEAKYLRDRLREAELLLRRGVKAIDRPCYAPGETDQEWYFAASRFLTGLKNDRAMAKMPFAFDHLHSPGDICSRATQVAEPVPPSKQSSRYTSSTADLAVPMAAGFLGLFIAGRPGGFLGAVAGGLLILIQHQAVARRRRKSI